MTYNGERIEKKVALAIVTALISLSGFKSLHAEEGTSLKFNEWVKEVSIKGDFRLRNEFQHRSNIHNDTTPSSTSARDRNRQRFRLRLGLDFKLPVNVTAKFQFASGTGEQVSTNQSFDNAGGQKGFWIDRAYLEWKPKEEIRFAAGKMNNPLWTLYSSDLVWDADFNPEGASESISLFGVPKTRVFINAAQLVMDEDSAGTKDQGVLTQQLGAEVLMFDESKLTAAVALHEWTNERAGNFGQDNTGLAGQPGNRTSGNSSTGTVTNEFRVVEYTAEYRTSLKNIPLSFQGTYIFNNKSLWGPAENNGFQYGVIIGKAAKAKSLELGLFYKRLEAEATVDDFADSDFGSSGGTNRRGAIGWLAYAPTEWSVFTLKHFVTKEINRTWVSSSNPGVSPANRTQLDLSVKF